MSDATLTLRELFDIDPKDVSAKVESGLDLQKAAEAARQEIVKEARTIRWPWVRDAVAAKSEDLLNLNVIDVLVQSWQKYMEIKKYADPKKYPPDEDILAPLATHTVKSQHHPYIEILLKEREVGRVVFDLDFSLVLEGFALKIRDGTITEVLTGSGKGEGELSLVKLSLWKNDSKPVHFPGQISLGKGIPLRSESRDN